MRESGGPPLRRKTGKQSTIDHPTSNHSPKEQQGLQTGMLGVISCRDVHATSESMRPVTQP